MSQSTKFEIWHGLLTEAVPDIAMNFDYSMMLYRASIVAWGNGVSYTYQGTWPYIDLTKLYDQTIMLATLKGINYGESENYQDY